MNQESKVTLPISIVIPTYSEEKVLPKVLASIKSQFAQPTEVIIADAKSPDKTREIAKNFGCKVVEGGRVSVGRNRGADASKCDYILFLDADTSFYSTTTLLEAFTEFLKSEVDIASAGLVADREGSTEFSYTAGKVMFNAWNALRSIQSVSQKVVSESGSFILVKRSVCEHIGGFNEKISIGEDRDFFARAVKHGYKYKHLSQNVITSTRRFSDPKKIVNIAISAGAGSLAIAAGFLVGSELVKRLHSRYGRLGGGDGRDPNDE
ncbi:glycosyltransferase [bacterium]|nr:glycosyltransferase [bacterium]